MTITIKSDVNEQWLRQLSPESLYGRAWKQAMDDIRGLVEKRAKTRAPKGKTLSIEPAITSRMDAREIPLFAVVEIKNMPTRASAKYPAFRYPGMLEGSKKSRYRSTRRKGKPTRGWFHGSMMGLKRYISRYFERAAKKIEENWGRG